jgi:hypothetical protein
LEFGILFPAPPEKLYPSRPSVTDRHLSTIDYDRDLPATAACLEHFVQKRGVLYHIPVIDFPSLTFEGLTGLDGVGSTQFAINDDLAHGGSSSICDQ